MTPEAALAALEARGDPARAAEMAAYHKVERRYLGLSNGTVEELARDWRADLDRDARVALAAALWDSDIFEARIAATKLLTQARIKPDDAPVWAEITRWVPQFDSWAIADAAAKPAERRLRADPGRLDELERWTEAENMWQRRAALVFTLDWAKGRHPSEADLAARERILGWAAAYTADREWFIQKAVGWWLRTLSKHDPERVHAFLAAHGDAMKAFARREATKHLA
ncbi:DNA alkylation repair protein [Pontivivens ytuae]|uniref:DNA alkylation repair protein n=1 Tax=Pontivivens ytuae TaxID=2789856 RepID=A0A7S9LQ01_9RHOB|nr:DNA alkylation repair protein [Pontivivens ytuae]QPH53174.1 DNA alkylation repair protein [Pontivivens ytuae]